jgi:hypothetical protein
LSAANSNRLRPLMFPLIAAGICLTAVFLPGQKAPPARQSKQATADYPPGPPFSVENVIELLSGIKRNILTEERLMMGLHKRGVDFRPTPELLSRLSDAGASDAVLGAVWKLAVAVPIPPPAPPPPPKPSFSMVMLCHPAECEVRVNDRPFEKTKSGQLLLENLDPGRMIVDLRKDGFDARTEVVDVPDKSSGTPTSHEVTLRPTEETQRQWGEDIKATALKAVVLNSAPRTVNGTVKISDHAGAIFDVAIHFEASGITNIELQTPAGHASIACRSARCLPSTKSFLSRQKAELLRSGKQLKAEDVEEYIPDLEVLLVYEFNEVFSRLLSSKGLATSSAEPSDSGAKALRIAAADSVYTVGFGADMKPASLVSELTTGAGPAGIRAFYSEYKKVGDLDYPSTTELKFGSEQHSILFQAHSITLNGSSVPPAK